MKQKCMSWLVLVLASLMLCASMTGCKDDSSQQQQPEVSLTDEQKQELQDEAQDIVDKIMGNNSSEDNSQPDTTTTNSMKDPETSKTQEDESLQEGADVGAQINGDEAALPPLIDMINEKRLAADLPALKENDALMYAASMRIQEVSFDRRLAYRHERPDGSQWETLFAESAAAAAPYGETILQGASDASVTLYAMLLSDEQSKQIYCTDYTQIGYAFRDDLTAWVILFSA